MGNPEWANDPIFNDRIQTADEYADKADAYLIEWLMKYDKEEIFKIAQDNRIPIAPIRTVEEVVNDAQLEARSFFAEVDHFLCRNRPYVRVEDFNPGVRG